MPYLQPSLGAWIRIPGVGILITFMAIFTIGVLITNFIGRKFINVGEYFLLKIPIAKSIYGSVKQILQTFSHSENEAQKKVVLVKYPREGIWSVGLHNGEILHPETKQQLDSILVLASINPTSGFFILVPPSDVHEIDISIEDAMKWIVSGGIITPANLKTNKS